MLYAYFGSKEGLFSAVLELAVERMRDTVELDASNRVNYAVAVFDAYSANTYLIRLALWQTLQAPGLNSQLTGISEARPGVRRMSTFSRSRYGSDERAANSLPYAASAWRGGQPALGVVGPMNFPRRVGLYAEYRLMGG